MMRVIRRIAILLIELVTEALFLGVLLGALLHSQDQWFYTLLGGVIALPAGTMTIRFLPPVIVSHEQLAVVVRALALALDAGAAVPSG